MRILLVGANGQLARDLIPMLGDEVVGLTHGELDICREAAVESAAAARCDQGFALARELFAWARGVFAGTYRIPPFKNYERVLEVISR